LTLLIRSFFYITVHGMKKSILKLRMLGAVTFLLYIVSVLFAPSPNPGFNFKQIQQLLMFISCGSFVVVMGLHIYSIYLNISAKDEDGEDE